MIETTQRRCCAEAQTLCFSLIGHLTKFRSVVRVEADLEASAKALQMSYERETTRGKLVPSEWLYR